MYKVYTKDNCKYCTFAKNLLITRNQMFIEIKLERDITYEDFIAEWPQVKTMPLILDGDRVIGGYDQLKEELDG